MKAQILPDGTIELTAENGAESAYLRTLAPKERLDLRIKEWKLSPAYGEKLTTFTCRIEQPQ